jgi:site-specific DNA recombinase
MTKRGTTKPRAACYARYSTELQSVASIKDQLRVCGRLAAQHGFTVVGEFSDAAISGGTVQRPSYQRMLEAARRGDLDVIVAEDTSRLWRNLAEQAPRLAELADLNVHVVTADLDTRNESAGILGAVLGAASEGYRKEIGRRTRRGLEGLARAGRPTGGKPYGYVSAAQSGSGEIEIDEAQAEVVRRIFTLYGGGASPRTIAELLNAENVPSPGSSWKRETRRKSRWLLSAIWGDPARGLGILNNEIYIGRVIWNRFRWVRSAADSSKRRYVLNPEAEWIVRDEPRLRIVSDDLWQRVKRRQRARAETIGASVRAGLAEATARRGRPQQYLLSGLVQCPECGSNYVIGPHRQYRCASNFNGGVSACPNRARFLRDEAEHELLAGLRERLLKRDVVEAVRRRVAEIVRAQSKPPSKGRAEEIADLERQRDRLVDAIASGGLSGSPAVAQRLAEIEASLERLQQQAQRVPAMPKVEKMLPGIVDAHRAFVADLANRLVHVDPDRARAEIRRLHGPVKAVPDGDKVRLEVEDGRFEAVLVEAYGGGAKPTVRNLVAGAGFEPATFGL